MDEDRRGRVTGLLRQSVIAWALAHVFASAMLLYSIYKPDSGGVEAWAYVLIGLGPIAVAMTYFEARAIWAGKDDPETWAHVSALAMLAVLGFLAWHLG